MATQYYVVEDGEFDLDDVEIDLFNNATMEPTHLYHKPLSVVSAQWLADNGKSVDLQVTKTAAKLTVTNPDSSMDGVSDYIPEQYDSMLDAVEKAVYDLIN